MSDVSSRPDAAAPSPPSAAARRRWWSLAALLVLLVLAASANGILNDFTYDDQYIVKQNVHIHSLKAWWTLFAQTYWPREWGAEGYRPLTMLAFAAEWAMAGGKPWIFHLVNILLTCVATVAVFALAETMLPLAAAWIAAAIFAVHPVHVEAVANVVGQSELWVAALFIPAVALYVRARQRGALRPGTIAGVSALYAGSLLFKEHAIVLPAVLLAAEATIIQDPRPLRERARALRPFVLWMGLLGVAYLWARSYVLRDSLSGFQPFVVFQALRLSNTDRILTMIGVVPEWLRLLFWPARLSSEYAPPYIDIAEGPSLVQLPGLLLLLGILGTSLAARRLKPTLTFGIWWFVIVLLPTSNFVVPAGIILAERTLFLPSVGVFIAFASLVPEIRAMLAARRLQLAGVGALALLLAAAGWKSWTRTAVWKDNDTLFRQAIKDSPLAYRAHYMLGAWLFQNKRKLEGEKEYRRALKLFPYDPYMAYNLAERYREQGMCKPAITMYQWSYMVRPEFTRGRSQYAWCLLIDLQLEEARKTALLAMSSVDGNVQVLRGIVAVADSALINTGRRPKPSWWGRARPAATPAATPPATPAATPAPGSPQQAGKLRDSMQNTGRKS